MLRLSSAAKGVVCLSCSVRVMRAGIEARDSCWWVQRLFNMSTITREWVALQHAHLMPFR